MALPTVRRRLWTRAAYDRVVEAGGFDEDDRIELLDGEIWEMSAPGSHHMTGCRLMEEALRAAFGTGYEIRREAPLALDDISQPQPDIAVVTGAIRDYTHAHPTRAVLLAEVSDSTHAHDRGPKLAAYARNGVPEYWILDLREERLEVYRDPAGDAYSSKAILAVGDTVSPLHAPQAAIPVSDILP